MPALDLMMPSGAAALLDRLDALPMGKRSIVAVAGAPGSGKSTLVDTLTVQLNRMAPDRAAVLPMDGFHFDDQILIGMGRIHRKGAPDTFDVGGLAHMLRRLRANTEDAVAVPVFDREIEASRGSARLIKRSTDVILVEGNYLLCDIPPWSMLQAEFDLTVMLDVAEEILHQRLAERWAKFGFGPGAANQRVEANDLPNGRFMREQSIEADFTLHYED